MRAHARSRLLSGIAAFAVALTALQLGSQTAPADAAAQVANGKIAFDARHDCCDEEIFSMNADGTALVQLTENESNDDGADWSRDGTKIVWAHTPDDTQNNIDIWVMNADGTDQTQLTSDPIPDWQPSWSPDGTKIAFTRREVDGEAADLFVMNSDGSGRVNLTNSPDLEDADAAWSPDGSKIAFARASVFDLNWEIYVMNANGSGPIQLTDDPSFDAYPAWSPDGQKIAFTTTRADSIAYGDVFAMNSDGSALEISRTALASMTACLPGRRMGRRSRI
jgi:Tol biopolymer transport system component